MQLCRRDTLGPAWLSSLHRQLIVQSNLFGAQIARGDGRVINFIGTGSGEFAAEADGLDQLLSVSGGYRYIDATGRAQESYNAQGQLIRTDKADGQRLVFTYSDTSTPVAQAPAPGYLLNVQDNFGRSLQFTYLLPTGGVAATDARINRITNPAGKSTTLAYDANGNLSLLTWADTAARQFLYENAGLAWALTGEIDENNSRYATIGYDTAGRAISTELAGGVERYSVAYANPPQIAATEVFDPILQVILRYHSWQMPGGTVVTLPNGTSTALGASSIHGYPRLNTQGQAAGSGCAASANAIGYDANGNRASQDDFNGSRVCYASDPSRNLEIARVEGLSNTTACSGMTAVNATLPAGSRKVSTAWHPDWRLLTKRAEANRVTTSVYNGQPDPSAGGAVASCAPSTAGLPDGKPIAVLCRQLEQATTDADGHIGFNAPADMTIPTRVQSWTYNQYGQVLTATDSLNHSTTYAYYANTTSNYTLGDLQSVTNAAGQITTYTQYTPTGQVLQSVDPNGVVTTNTYDLRSRLTSTSVDGQITTYGYDAAGQLTKVTLPDASYKGYEYDAAHRQTAVFDNLGNRIDYTLDNMGNRVAEKVKDPGGALKRQLTRSMDALNRVVQTVGGE